MHFEHSGWPRSKLCPKGKIAIFGPKWVFLAILRGFCGVECPERSTYFSHNIQNSALKDEKLKNGGQKGFLILFVFVLKRAHWAEQTSLSDSPITYLWGGGTTPPLSEGDPGPYNCFTCLNLPVCLNHNYPIKIVLDIVNMLIFISEIY